MISLGASLFCGLAWAISKDKLKLDLYNRRFAIYDATLKLYQSVTSDLDDANASAEVIKTFILPSRESRFLFDSKDGVYQLLDAIRGQCNLFIAEKIEKEKGADADPDRINYWREKLWNEEFNKLDASMHDLEARLSSYLDFHRVYNSNPLSWVKLQIARMR